MELWPAYIVAAVILLIAVAASFYILGDRHGTKETERRWSDACKKKDHWDGHPSVDARIASAMHESKITDIVSQYILESYRHAAVQTWFVCSICTCACNVPAGISYKDLRAAIDWHIRHDCPGSVSTRPS